MKKANIYTSAELLSKKEIKSQKSEIKKANHESFKDLENALKGAFKMLVNSSDKLSRDCANRCKSVFRSESEIIANCFPFQSIEGELQRITTNKNGNKEVVKYIPTANNIKRILEISIKNYIDSLANLKYKLVINLEYNEISDYKEFKKAVDSLRKGLEIPLKDVNSLYHR